MDFDLTEEQACCRTASTKLLADAYSFDQRKAMRALPGGYDPRLWRSSRTWGCWPCPSPKPTADLGAAPST